MPESERIEAALSAGKLEGPPAPAGDEDPNLKKWRAELARFQSMREELARDERYADGYVAVKDGRVVGSDTDDFRLAERMAEEYPGEVVLIARPDGVVPFFELASPEFRQCG